MSALENISQEELKNPDYVPPLQVGLILGLQHVLAMFVSNVTPSIIIAGVAGFAFGSADTGLFNTDVYAISQELLR
jgi:NCS2 family nucleobase:cation symporter-2